MLLMLLACAGGSVSLDDTATLPGDSDPGVVDADQDGSPEGEDCDDDDPLRTPGADEVCDGVDNDCDGEVDNEAIDTVAYHLDMDGDGFGSSETVSACEVPLNAVDNGLDCDDTNPLVNPDAQEVCDPDDLDEDCNGLADDDDSGVDPATYGSWWEDADGDGYGTGDARLAACDPWDSYVDNNDDCDDGDPSVWDECGGAGWDGSYSGTMELKVTASSLGVSDTCSGTATIDVAEADTPQIDGTMSCSFSGILASIIGSQTATVDGELFADDSASGTIDVGGLISDSWTGGFTSAKGGTLEGSVSGTTVYSGYTVDYTGSFTVTR